MSLQWRDPEGMTVWALFKKDTKYFDPSRSSFMINYRVDDLDALLAALKEEGVEIDPSAKTTLTTVSPGSWTRKTTGSSCGSRLRGHRMKRLSVDFDDDIWKRLQAEALQSRCSTSELVRRAVREKYLTTRKEALLSAIGLWKDRTDLPDTKAVRGLRKDTRLKRIFK